MYEVILKGRAHGVPCAMLTKGLPLGGARAWVSVGGIAGGLPARGSQARGSHSVGRDPHDRGCRLKPGILSGALPVPGQLSGEAR